MGGLGFGVSGSGYTKMRTLGPKQYLLGALWMSRLKLQTLCRSSCPSWRAQMPMRPLMPRARQDVPWQSANLGLWIQVGFRIEGLGCITSGFYLVLSRTREGSL